MEKEIQVYRPLFLLHCPSNTLLSSSTSFALSDLCTEYLLVYFFYFFFLVDKQFMELSRAAAACPSSEYSHCPLAVAYVNYSGRRDKHSVCCTAFCLLCSVLLLLLLFANDVDKPKRCNFFLFRLLEIRAGLMLILWAESDFQSGKKWRLRAAAANRPDKQTHSSFVCKSC